MWYFVGAVVVKSSCVMFPQQRAEGVCVAQDTSSAAASPV